MAKNDDSRPMISREGPGRRHSPDQDGTCAFHKSMDERNQKAVQWRVYLATNGFFLAFLSIYVGFTMVMLKNYRADTAIAQSHHELEVAKQVTRLEKSYERLSAVELVNLKREFTRSLEMFMRKLDENSARQQTILLSQVEFRTQQNRVLKWLESRNQTRPYDPGGGSGN